MRQKRYAMPKFWPGARKRFTWAPKARPGPHAQSICVPLGIILRDVLHYAESGPEAKRALKQGKILVDKRPAKEPGFPVGLMDVIEIPNAKKYFRVLMSKGGLVLAEIGPDQTGLKLCKIRGKTTVRGGKMQLNLHDGRNILVKEPKKYRRGDSVLIGLPEQKILAHFKFQPGELATIILGTSAGAEGKIKEIYNRKDMLERSTVTIQTKDKMIQTLKEYTMVGRIPTKVPKKPEVKKAPKKPEIKKPEIKRRKVKK